MNFKALLWTSLMAILLFFTVVYLGMKYDWVNEAKPKYTSSDAIKNPITSAPSTPNNRLTTQAGNGIKPKLIDEAPVIVEGQTLGSSKLTIEEVVTECQSIATSVGIPEQQFDQAVLECIDRNSNHLKSEQNQLNERTQRIQEQCDMAITQKEFLSAEEIKILIDECVASMQ